MHPYVMDFRRNLVRVHVGVGGAWPALRMLALLVAAAGALLQLTTSLRAAANVDAGLIGRVGPEATSFREIELTQSQATDPPSLAGWRDGRGRLVPAAGGELTCRSAASGAGGAFRLYHAMNLRKQDSGPNIPRMPIAGSAKCLFPEGVRHDSPPDLRYIEQHCISRFRRDPPPILVLDIEKWRVDGGVSESRRRQSLENFRQTIALFRAELPTIQFGLYRMIPRRFAHPEASMRKKEAWKRANEANRELAEMVDVVFPSLYTLRSLEDPELWRRYAEANIEEAAQYGKPIMPFIWGRYYNRGDKDAKTNPSLPYDFWKMQLEYLLRHPDVEGAVMWDWSSADWDNLQRTEYWRATVDFLEEYCVRR